MDMVTRTIPNFSLSQICRSGQCFRMEEKEDHTMVIIAGDRYLEARQQGEECCFYCEETEFEGFWKEYFDLENDYAVYTERINPNDAYLRQAVGYGSGIRILRQELWEMIVSFLISQQNNIVRIRRCIKNICECYGDIHVNGRGEAYYGFPKPEVLAELQDDDLKACNLGYRSKYVVRAARSVVSGEIDLKTVSRLPYCKAREALLSLYGVGEKVADCICLFALHHLQAFPVDTHIQQAMQAHYRRGFPKRRYQGFQGVIQQYIFYYELYGKMEAGYYKLKGMKYLAAQNREILLIEDDDSLNRAVGLKLVKEGYTVYAASSVKEAERLYRAHAVSVILCDIGLPDGSGLDFCMAVRQNSGKVLFLFLTALDTEADMLNGYEAGADDYITKPFSMAVLVSKVNAMMKRCSLEKIKSRIKSGSVTLFLDENRAKKDGEYLSLTLNETKLLTCFMQNPMRILSKNQLLEAIWDIDGSYVDDNTVAVNIRRLREKIEDNPSQPALIKNVRGLGYIWERECERL